MPDEITHEKMLAVVQRLPGDYAPWGEVVRWEREDEAYPDCSWGCAYAAWLAGALGADWCVTNEPLEPPNRAAHLRAPGLQGVRAGGRRGAKLAFYFTSKRSGRAFSGSSSDVP